MIFIASGVVLNVDYCCNDRFVYFLMLTREYLCVNQAAWKFQYFLRSHDLGVMLISMYLQTVYYLIVTVIKSKILLNKSLCCFLFPLLSKEEFEISFVKVSFCRKC